MRWYNFLVIILSIVTSVVCEGDNYIGISSLYSNLKPKDNFGGNLFKKRYAPGLQISLGHIFNNVLGVEAGVEINDHDSSIVSIPAKEVVLGTIDLSDPFLVYNSYKSKINQHHEYLGITINNLQLTDNFFISMLFGAALSHIKLKYNLFYGYVFDYYIAEPEEILSNNINYFNKTGLNFISQLSIGYKYNNKLHISLLSGYKNLSKLKGYVKFNNNIGKVKYKNAFIFGIKCNWFV